MAKNELANFSANVPAHLQNATSSLGNENVSAEDTAIPRIKLLQSLSPEVNKRGAEYVEGAEAGSILTTVTNDVNEELYVCNLFFKKEFVAFKKRALGGNDFQGAHESREAAMEHLTGQNLNAADYDINESHRHVVAIINPADATIDKVAILSMTGTNVAQSRNWNTAIVNQGFDRFSGVWKLSTLEKSNTKGNWFVFNPEFAGFAPEGLHKELTEMYHNFKSKGMELAEESEAA